jgi:receptor protein-tyrosine kinase
LLIGAYELEDVVQHADLIITSDDVEGDRQLNVIVAGALPPNPAKMLESKAMTALLQDAASKYDFVVIDTPPLEPVADCLALMPVVDGVVIVARMGESRRDTARRLIGTLRAVNAPLLGVVANQVKSRFDARYGYEYRSDSRQTARVGVPLQGNGHAFAGTVSPKDAGPQGAQDL